LLKNLGENPQIWMVHQKKSCNSKGKSLIWRQNQMQKWDILSWSCSAPLWTNFWTVSALNISANLETSPIFTTLSELDLIMGQSFQNGEFLGLHWVPTVTIQFSVNINEEQTI
jgi:hypothetical protein